MRSTERWWREKWKEAVYASDLNLQERMVCITYADHARDRGTAWVTLDRLVHVTGMSRTRAQAWRKSVIQKGWLVEWQKATQHNAAHYLLDLPQTAHSPAPSDISGCPSVGSLEDSRVPTGESRVPTGEAQGARQWAPINLNNPSNQSLAPAGAASGPGGPTADRREERDLTPGQRVVMKKLDMASDDPRVGSIEAMLEHHNVRSAKAWVGSIPIEDLVDNLDAQHAKGGGFAPESATMPNPNYIEGWGTPARIPVSEWGHRELTKLGAEHPAIVQETVVTNAWDRGDRIDETEGWARAVEFVRDGLLCPECYEDVDPDDDSLLHYGDCSREPRYPPDCEECDRTYGKHYQTCSQYVPILCAGGCGQEVKWADAVMKRACKVCGHRHAHEQYFPTTESA